MNHYVYQIDFTNSKKYIGVRSSKCLPEEDINYLGSCKSIPTDAYKGCVKTILATFDTRHEAVMKEIELHEKYNVKSNEDFYNQVNQTVTKFDQQGCTKKTHKHVAEMAKKLTGRNRNTHEYIEDLSIKQKGKQHPNHKKYTDSVKGVPQGNRAESANKGAKNHKTKPWYYITPDFKYYEVHTSIPEFFATCTSIPEGMTERMVKYNVSQNAHIPASRGSMAGFTIGRLESKPSYISQYNLDLMIKLAGHTNTKAISTLHKKSRKRTPQQRNKENGQFLINSEQD